MLIQLKQIVQSSRQLISFLGSHPRTPALSTGLALGLLGWSAAGSFVATFGFTQHVITGLLLATATGLALGIRFSGSPRGQAAREHAGLPGVALLIFLPTTLGLASRLVGLFSLELLENHIAQVAALAVAATVTLGLPAFFAGWTAGRYLSTSQTRPLLIGIGLGIPLLAIVLAPVVGQLIPSLVVAGLVALDWLRRLAHGTPRSAIASPSTPAANSPMTTTRRLASPFLTAIAAILAGRVLTQLMPEAAYLIAAGAAAFLLSAVLGSWLAQKLSGRGWSHSSLGLVGAMLTATGLLAPLAFFPWLTDQHLTAVAQVDSVLMLMSIRIITIASVIIQIGLGSGVAARAFGANDRPISSVVVFSLGLASGGWLIPIAGVVNLSLALASALVVISLPVPAAWPVRSDRRILATAAAAGLCICLLAGNASRYQPQQAAKLLFDTETFISYQRGFPRELLPYLDDTRLISTRETLDGTVTLWKKNGVAVSGRIDGIPVALASTETRICPTASGELMRVVLPLILHDKPRSLLLLGDPAHVASQVAVGFPLQELVRLERGDLAQGATNSLKGLFSGVRDERLSSFEVEPRLGLVTLNHKFDVIVSDPGAPAILQSTPYLTREFYTTAASKLAADGIFCQRWRSADFGPEPLRVVAQSMQQAFQDVMLIEIGVGEYALLGTSSPQGLVRNGLLERLQRPQVRQTLATLGWDWCIPLNLMALDNQVMGKLASEASGLNDAANVRLAYSLPPEMMRWGPKSQETAAATNGLTTRLLEKGVPPEEQKDVVDRIAQVIGQRNLMTRFPDQPWAYRKEVRAQLKESSRSVIQKVNAEIRHVMHPEDRRRLDYFEALGKAIGNVTPQTLAKLESFAEPYDPMITYFLRHEIAPLYAQLGEEGAGAELANRLHASYYADPKDRSVRNVLDAIGLLVRQPELVPDSDARFDHLNGLIEVLLRRWENRGTAEPRSPEIVMVDIDNTLDATEEALSTMDDLASAAGLDANEWQRRKTAIDRTLTRPLRKYRTTLMPHLRKAQKQTAETNEAG